MKKARDILIAGTILPALVLGQCGVTYAQFGGPPPGQGGEPHAQPKLPGAFGAQPQAQPHQAAPPHAEPRPAPVAPRTAPVAPPAPVPHAAPAPVPQAPHAAPAAPPAQPHLPPAFGANPHAPAQTPAHPVEKHPAEAPRAVPAPTTQQRPGPGAFGSGRPTGEAPATTQQRPGAGTPAQVPGVAPGQGRPPAGPTGRTPGQPDGPRPTTPGQVPGVVPQGQGNPGRPIQGGPGPVGRPDGGRPDGGRPDGRPEGGRPDGRTEGGRPDGRTEGGRPDGRTEGGRPDGGRPEGDRRGGGIGPGGAAAIGAAAGFAGGFLAATGARGIEDIRRDRREVNEGGVDYIREPGRTIVRDGDRSYVVHDENERFRDLGLGVRTEQRGADNVAIFDRPGGEQILTYTDREGRLLRRVRRFRDGREIVIIDNGYGGRVRDYRDDVVVLPPEPLGMPRERFIVDANGANEDVLYDTLIAPPVAPVARRYTLDQVRYSPDLRGRMRSVDVDTLNFDPGSWIVPPDQANKLQVLGNAVKKAVSRNANEVFLVEGYTDATGNPTDNLSLSDRRAQSVATILTRDFGVPPENLTTQGYGQQYLKEQTQASSRVNRRVTLRRITPLLAAGDGAPK